MGVLEDTVATVPTLSDIRAVRKAVFVRVAEARADDYDDRDLERVSVDDHYIRRFLLQYKNDPDVAVMKIIDTLLWRKSINANDINHDNVNRKLIQVGQLVAHNRDIDGNKLLICTVRKHVKNVFTRDELRNFFVYWIERLEREEYPGKITMVFDMSGAAVANVDIDFVQCFIDILDNYYPWFVQDILIFELHVILRMIWKIIEAFFPASSKDKVKKVTKDSITEYVSEDQCLASWGGLDDFNYVAAPEQPLAALPWLTDLN